MNDGTTCNCVTTPCDCDGPQKIDPLPMPFEPAPKKIGGIMPFDAIKGIDVTPPVPVVNNYYLQDPNEKLIFGFKPIYVIGAAVLGLFLFSSMDGKK